MYYSNLLSKLVWQMNYNRFRPLDGYCISWPEWKVDANDILGLQILTNFEILGVPFSIMVIKVYKFISDMDPTLLHKCRNLKHRELKRPVDPDPTFILFLP